MSKQVNYNENLCSGAAIRDDKGRRISKLFEASHPKMTVGYAKNLIMPDTPTAQEFNLRQSGGGVIEDGVAVIDKVKGNSVVWNQRVNEVEIMKSQVLSGVTITNNNGTLSINGTAVGNFEARLVTIATTKIKGGHKYFLNGIENTIVYWWGNSATLGPIGGKEGYKIATLDVSWTDITPYMVLHSGEVVNATYRPQVIDLTQMFGEGNEPTTYEEFLRRKPIVADEYAYNEGTIVSNKVEKVKTTGVNLWDERWENGSIDVNNGGVDKPLSTTFRSKNYTPIPSGATLYVNRGGYNATLTIAEYNAKKEYIGYKSIYANGAIEMPSNVAFIRFYLEPNANTSIYKNDICINISDPAINGQYFPYEKHELDLSWIKEIKDEGGVALFEGGMKSAGTAYDEVAKGRAIKRIGVKVFDGTEDWRIIVSAIGFNIGIPNALRYNVLVVGYTYRAGSWELEDMEYSVNDYFIGFKNDKYADIESWKAHLADLYTAGTPLVVYYELAEPIEVEYDEKNLTYPVVAGGTEEAIASEPSTAFRADIGYGIDAVKTILDLKARVEALEAK